jgi:hypothetical protein
VTPSHASFNALDSRANRNPTPPRRHDLDALRASAMLLGIAYHSALSFSLGAGWLVQDPRQSKLLYLFQAFTHGFRMQLFMLLSGFFTAMLWRRGGLKKLWLNRLRRVLLPCVAGLFTVVPAIDWAGAQAICPQQPPQHKPLPRSGAEVPFPDRISSEKRAPRPTGSVAHAQPSPAEGGSPKAGNDGPRPSSILPLRQCFARRGFRLGPPASSDWAEAEASPPPLARSPEPTCIHGQAAAEKSVARIPEAEHEVETPNLPQSNARTTPPLPLRFAQRATIPSGTSEPSLDSWTDWIKPAGAWVAKRIGRPAESMFILLWFLWFLVWLLPCFSIYAAAAQRFEWRIPPHALLVSQRNMLWLLPLTLAPALRMNTKNSDFGPETSLGILPEPRVLLYYGIFFGFGVLYHECGDPFVRLGQLWRRTLPFTLLVVFPAGAELTSGVFGIWEKIATGECPRWVCVSLQTLYAWLMCFSLMGLFRSLLKREYRAVRQVCDASYWCYLAHLPVVILLQSAVAPLNLPAFVKFVLVVGGVCLVMALTYAILFKLRWIGRFLKGRFLESCQSGK